MATVFPFRALRYDFARAGGDPGSILLTNPSGTSAGRIAQLASRTPHHAARLAMPELVESEGESRTDPVALALKWLEVGVLVRDADPALHVLCQSYSATVGGVDERFRRFLLVAATSAVPETPILDVRPRRCVHDDPNGEVYALTRFTADEVDPWFVYLDESSVEHRIHRIDDPERVRAVIQAFETRQFVPLGHRVARPTRLVALASLADPGLVSLPVHRLVPAWEGLNLDSVRATLAPNFELDVLPWTGVDSTEALLAEIAPQDHAFGLRFRRDDRLLLARARRGSLPDPLARGPAWTSLDARVSEDYIEMPLRQRFSAPSDVRPVVSLRSPHRPEGVLDHDPAWSLALLSHPASPQELWSLAREGSFPPSHASDLAPPVPAGLVGLLADE